MFLCVGSGGGTMEKSIQLQGLKKKKGSLLFIFERKSEKWPWILGGKRVPPRLDPLPA